MTDVWRSLADVPATLGPTVVTIGNFDGVHRGHQAVLERLVAGAKARDAASVAVTFDPHPKAVHAPEHSPELVTGLQDRVERMAASGVDGILVQTYTLEFAMQTPEEFAQGFLVEGLRAAVVVVGRDTRFGRGNAGDVDTMRALGERLGFQVEVIEDAVGELEGTRRWSSTWVRELLEAGDMRTATEVLGRPHRLRGAVVHGDEIGREIGFPTANLAVSGGYIPRHGVYAGWLQVVDARGGPGAEPWMGVALPSAVSLGINYTVGGTELRVEAHVIDRLGLDLYGAEVTLDLVEWRRPMLDFGGLDGLIEALAEDVAWCREVLGLLAP
jgi:riboflavin kinase/FMN adenylyltransferase